MGYRIKIKCCMLSVLMILSTANCTFAAGTKASKEAKLKKVNQEIKAKQSQLSKIKESKNDFLKQIKAMDSKMNSVQNQISKYNVSIQNKNQNILQIKNKLRIATVRLKKQKKLLYGRMEVMYEVGNESILDVLFTSKNFFDFLSRTQIMSDIVEYDNDLLQKYHKAQNYIAQKKREEEEEKRNLEKLKGLQVKVMDTLNSDMQKKHTLVAALEKEQSTYEAEIDSELATSNQLASEIARLQQNSNVIYSSGGFVWPGVNHLITSPFGYRVHPIFGVTKMHTGVDVGVPYGSSVRATKSGKVVMAGWYGGYGNAVIIDHGDGISSLYGHNSRLAVSVGEMVSAGQVISYVGATGYATGPHLHFEIRKNGSPVNPLDYVR